MTVTASAGAACRPLVLHADQHNDTREMLQVMLEPYGVAVVGVDNGATAYDTAVSLQPDLVVLELALPALDGYALTSKLKATESLRTTPVMAWTASSDAPSQRRAEAAGCDRVLIKAGCGDAVETILALLGRRAARA